MAKKSKTQRAKASAARQARKEKAKELKELEAAGVTKAAEETPTKPEEKKISLFKKSSDDAEKTPAKQEAAKPAKKAADKNANPGIVKRFTGFLKDVKGELKRVTWPTKQDVLRWSVVVVVALLFFGIYVTVLDGIVTQILVGISGLANLV